MYRNGPQKREIMIECDMMNTETAKEIARHRHAVMESYLKEFIAEWKGEKYYATCDCKIMAGKR